MVGGPPFEVGGRMGTYLPSACFASFLDKKDKGQKRPDKTIKSETGGGGESSWKLEGELSQPVAPGG